MSNVAFTPKDAQRTTTKPGRVLICTNVQCRLSLKFGIYFDGTNNNLEDDEPNQSHSNVARLYKAAYDEPTNGLHAIYVPGVGTPFPRIGEITPHEDGARKGAMGAERIRYAILEIANRIAFVLTKKPLVEPAKIPAAVKTDDHYTNWNRRLTALVAQSRQRAQGPHIEEIVLDVFGFSRGAAGARSFVNQLLKHFSPDGKSFCSVPLRIRFVGLFDTVASVGYADSIPGPFEGHQKWGDEDLLTIPPQVEQCVHFVAGHEGRKSFPVDLVLREDGTYPPNCIEVVYPGVHSDVGGGYGPKDQGKGTGHRGQDEMLSQIPLNDMYERALRAGVPLRSREKLIDARLDAQFAIGKTLQNHYDLYLSETKSACQGKPATRHYETHLGYYLHWRYEHLSDAAYLRLLSVNRAPQQDRINLVQSNQQFRSYLVYLEQADRQMARYEAVHDPRTAPPPADVTGVDCYRKYWKEATTTLYDNSDKIHDFFDFYVHDSRAGFTIVDPVTQHDHRRIHQQLQKKDAPYRQALKEHDRIVADYYARGELSGYTATTLPSTPRDPMTPRERRNLAIYDKTPKDAKVYVEVPVYDDRTPGTWDDGHIDVLIDGIAAVDGRREARWSYLHPRQFFAYSRLEYSGT